MGTTVFNTIQQLQINTAKQKKHQNKAKISRTTRTTITKSQEEDPIPPPPKKGDKGPKMSPLNPIDWQRTQGFLQRRSKVSELFLFMSVLMHAIAFHEKSRVKNLRVGFQSARP